ncbi:hypothetical protein JTB14_037161 [Gonioctena quinquepunctata]|nr:hypothetical protein JTB14_037161 [Gonioctena quinquepunctata]
MVLFFLNMESENFNPKKCCVPDCEDLYSKRHRFPRPDREVELFKIWVDKVKNPLFNGKTDEQIYKTYLVCDVHFRNYFKVVSHRGLSKIAFPTLYLLESSNENIEDNQIPVKRAKVDNLIDEVTIDQEQGSEFLVPIINPGEGTSTSRLELHEIHSHNAVGNSSSCASSIVGGILDEENLTVDLISTLSLLLLLGLYVFLIWLLEVGTVRNICVPYNN